MSQERIIENKILNQIEFSKEYLFVSSFVCDPSNLLLYRVVNAAQLASYSQAKQFLLIIGKLQHEALLDDFRIV